MVFIRLIDQAFEVGLTFAYQDVGLTVNGLEFCASPRNQRAGRIVAAAYYCCPSFDSSLPSIGSDHIVDNRTTAHGIIKLQFRIQNTDLFQKQPVDHHFAKIIAQRQNGLRPDQILPESVRFLKG